MRMYLKAAILAASLTAAPALAQSVITIDLNRVYTDSLAGKSGTAQMQAKYQSQVTAATNTLNTASTAYNAQVEAARKVAKPDGSIPDANQKSLGEAEQRAEQAQENRNNLVAETQAVGQYVQGEILDKVLPIAEQIRAERKASLVIPRGSALAADPTADVTTTLIQRLDAQMKTVSIALPQQGQAAAAPATRGTTGSGR